MVDGWIQLSNISLLVVSNKVQHIHMLPEIKHAKSKVETSKLVDLLTITIVMPFGTLYKSQVFQLPLMHQTGHSMQVEFSATVEPQLTTEFYSLEVMDQLSGELKTHGEEDGEKMDSLD